MNHDHIMLVMTVTLIVLGAALAAGADDRRQVIPTDSGDLVVHPIHHATFVMEWKGATIYVDPVGGADRFAAFAGPDLILLTHVHGDHTSTETLAEVSQEASRIIAPASVAEKLGGEVPGQVTVLAHDETFSLAGIEVAALPAYNLTEDRLAFHPRDRKDNAYVISIGGSRIFISGDTEDVPEMRKLEDIDVAFVCMNLPYTMTVEQAADAVLEFNPKVIYPYHYRGKGGMSDLEDFAARVAANPEIDVRLIDWYSD